MDEEQAGQQRATVLRFSTRGIAPGDRVTMWEGHNARALISLDIRTIDESPMHATESNLQLASLRLAQVTGTPQIVERSESFIRANPTGVVAVFFALEGEAFFYHRGGHESLRPGQALVCDADAPFMRGFSRGLRETVLTIPKELYREITGSPAPSSPRVFEFGPGAGPRERALARLLHRTLARVPVAPGAESSIAAAGTIESEAIDLLRLVLGDGHGGAGGYIAAAKEHIERRLSDPALDVAEISAAVGLSERQLGRVFAAAGTTVARYLLARRLETAHGYLVSPAHGALAMSEVAALSGFASPSHFGKRFREHHGNTPLQVRSATRATFLAEYAKARVVPPTGA
ncbi:AraC family transcriptional regulator [Paeniglutamicibacter cryotolerans]|uniref:AraC-like DNA-binding protein n=1 Tax=Paeniglutamicibacter cryotolerans TaxID=670079 RepID=A0A839QPW8_9MICC|nr:AraC family transcriptional regulator [Paeniglutamicibacter cryotolerans]MBB2995292.1 AraC-like DNA-binding protein [Paeniglutamicibacter cryotolerans]